MREECMFVLQYSDCFGVESSSAEVQLKRSYYGDSAGGWNGKKRSWFSQSFSFLEPPSPLVLSLPSTVPPTHPEHLLPKQEVEGRENTRTTSGEEDRLRKENYQEPRTKSQEPRTKNQENAEGQ